jgi:hypothetical protein
VSLKPRHFVLLAVVLALFAFNIIRNRRAKMPTDGPAPMVTTTNHIPAQTPAWSSFDHAAGLRDAPEDQFGTALAALDAQMADTHDATVADIRGCRTWLVFFRQGVNHPSKDTAWKDRSNRHLDGCVKFHLDTTL